MAAAEGGSQVGDSWPKWQIALAVGAPVVVGAAGLWLYRRHKSSASGKDKKAKTDGSAAVNEIDADLQDPVKRAQAAKNKGNKFFKGGKFDKAIECYGEAIAVCPKDQREDIATFYQNRAAAYEQLKNYKSVIEDCTTALEYNKQYVKALARRAKAAEITNDLPQCLEDITAVCILEGFSNQQSLMMADRVLKDLGRSRAKERYSSRQPQDPSRQFIHNYFSAFTNDPILSSLSGVEKREAGTPDGDSDEKEKVEEMEKDSVQASPYKKALQQLKNKQYGDIVKLCTDEIKLVSSPNLAEALLLRGTFYLLRGETNCVMEDFEQLLSMEGVDKRIRSNALIKRGSLKMQQGQQDEAMEDFNQAVSQDPENSDIYHHRGQLHLLLEKIEEAVRDFDKSVQLSPNFAIAHVQKCYTDFRLASVTASMMSTDEAIKSFERTIQKFPNCAEGYALYGQVLIDLKMFEKADENFKRAIELEPDNGNIYVHRGLLRLQWKQDIDEAARLITKAMQIDEKCEFAYETLGTIEIQRGCLDKAIELFNRAIELTKTEAEMAHLFSLLDAAVAQSRVAKNLGIQLPSLA